MLQVLEDVDKEIPPEQMAYLIAYLTKSQTDARRRHTCIDYYWPSGLRVSPLPRPGRSRGWCRTQGAHPYPAQRCLSRTRIPPLSARLRRMTKAIIRLRCSIREIMSWRSKRPDSKA